MMLEVRLMVPAECLSETPILSRAQIPNSVAWRQFFMSFSVYLPAESCSDFNFPKSVCRSLGVSVLFELMSLVGLGGLSALQVYGEKLPTPWGDVTCEEIQIFCPLFSSKVVNRRVNWPLLWRGWVYSMSPHGDRDICLWIWEQLAQML